MNHQIIVDVVEKNDYLLHSLNNFLKTLHIDDFKGCNKTSRRLLPALTGCAPLIQNSICYSANHRDHGSQANPPVPKQCQSPWRLPRWQGNACIFSAGWMLLFDTVQRSPNNFSIDKQINKADILEAWFYKRSLPNLFSEQMRPVDEQKRTGTDLFPPSTDEGGRPQWWRKI